MIHAHISHLHSRSLLEHLLEQKFILQADMPCKGEIKVENHKIKLSRTKGDSEVVLEFGQKVNLFRK